MNKDQFSKSMQTIKNYIDTNKGDNGVTPSISIGTVTTLEPNQQATVTRRGTDTNPIFDFGIPKGEKGEGSTGGGENNCTTDKLLLKYVYNSNKIIQPTSLDCETGIFTCDTPHELSSGTKLILALNYDSNYNITWIPYELYIANPCYQYNSVTAIVVSDTQFKLQKYGTTEDMVFTNSKNTNINVSRFRFETLGATVLNITNLSIQENTSKVKIRVVCNNGFEINEGTRIDGLLNNTSNFSHHFIGKDISKGFRIVPWIDYSTVKRFQRPFYSFIEVLVAIRDEYSFTVGNVFKGGIATVNDNAYKDSWNTINSEGQFNEYCNEGSLNGIGFNDSFKVSLTDTRCFFNGTIIEVYEVGGE